MSEATKFTGLILASGVIDGDPTLTLLEALAPFRLTILDSSLITIRDRFIFSLLIELIPDHTEAVAADLDAITAAGKVDIAYDFSPFAHRPSQPSTALCTFVGAKLSPSLVLAINSAIAGRGCIRHFSIQARDGFSFGTIQADLSPEAIGSLREELKALSTKESVAIYIEPSTHSRSGNDAILLDMDSTFINEEVIDLIADIAGVGVEVASITERAMQGELNFEESLRARVRLLKGQPISIFDLARARLNLTPGAIELVATLHQRRSRVGIVSGGFHDVIDEFLAPLNLDLIHANRFEIEDGTLTGEVLGDIVGPVNKSEVLGTFSQSSSRSIAIGDGANDILMIEAADIGIAFCAKPKLIEVADISLTHRDLRSILPLIGYEN